MDCRGPAPWRPTGFAWPPSSVAGLRLSSLDALLVVPSCFLAWPSADCSPLQPVWAIDAMLSANLTPIRKDFVRKCPTFKDFRHLALKESVRRQKGVRENYHPANVAQRRGLGRANRPDRSAHGGAGSRIRRHPRHAGRSQYRRRPIWPGLRSCRDRRRPMRASHRRSCRWSHRP
jgi:hypothetical protein